MGNILIACNWSQQDLKMKVYAHLYKNLQSNCKGFNNFKYFNTLSVISPSRDTCNHKNKKSALLLLLANPENDPVGLKNQYLFTEKVYLTAFAQILMLCWFNRSKEMVLACDVRLKHWEQYVSVSNWPCHSSWPPCVLCKVNSVHSTLMLYLRCNILSHPDSVWHKQISLHYRNHSLPCCLSFLLRSA